MKRVVIPELLDTDAGTPEEISSSIRDLRMFNRWFGGISTVTYMLRRIAKQRDLRELSWIDVAGSEGFMAAQTQHALARSGVHMKPVIVDMAPTHLSKAFPAVCGDATALPFRDNSFDIVGCSLFLHHLEPDQIVRFVREGLRVARHAFFIHDLRRHFLHLAMSYIGQPIYRSRITRHDAVASVRRAYTVNEVQEILKPVVGAGNLEIKRSFLYRMGVIAWKQPNTI